MLHGWLCLVGWLALSAGAEEAVLVDFDYATDAAAQAAWQPDEDSLPVRRASDGDRRCLAATAEFSGDRRRAVYDHRLRADLSRWGRFTLDLKVAQPKLAGGFTLYFQTPTGWWAHGGNITGSQWQTLEFSRAGFRAEGQPGGWDQIIGVRLSLWRGMDGQSEVLFDNLRAYRDQRVIVLGTNTIAKDSGEARTVQQQAQQMAELLRSAGISIGSMTDEEVEQGGLADRTFAIFPYNPDISDAGITAILDYLRAGGKVMLFYKLPAQLAEALGLRVTGWRQQRQPGEFSQIRFDTTLAAGLPATLDQVSWNLTTIEPLPGAGGAKVLGAWYDSAGQPTNEVAFSLHERGVFMSHILLGQDPHRTNQLLTALLGQLDPTVWPEVAAKALAGPDQIGHLMGLEAVTAQARQPGAPASASAALEASETAREQARQQIAARNYPAALAAATAANEALQRAYLLSTPSRPREFRACWEHAGTGAYPEGWEVSMKKLADCGFNAVVPNQFWGGLALYQSDLLPVSPIVAERGDQVALAVAAGKRHGIEVHPWKVNWRLGRTTPEFAAQMAAEDRLQYDFRGERTEWLEPSDPRNQELEIATMVEVATKYDVDGIHFDYIRYPGTDSGYGENARRRFEAATGLTVANWPADTRTDPKVREAWIQWRCDNITTVVRGVAERLRPLKPHVKISAAVFREYPSTRVSVSQDWGYWVEQGWLDFVCPMDYTNSDATFARTVAQQMETVKGRIPLYPGIGASSSSSTLSADRVAGQIALARELGAEGFIIFNYTRTLGEQVLPGVGLGATAEPTWVPHNGPAFAFELGALSQDITYGRHLSVGEPLQATVRRGIDLAPRNFGVVHGEVVIEDSRGRIVQRLGQAPPPGQPLAVTAALTPGLYRLVVSGEVELAEGGRRQFAHRSLPVVVGSLPEAVRLLF